jgi:predicted aspartyl protease
MGHFNVQTRIIGPTGVSELVDLFVDTGATFLTIPRSLAERLELRSARTLAIVTAGGREEVWPLASVQIELEGHEVPTPCLIAPDGPPLLGAVALESLVLAVDPVAKRLLPSKAYVLAQGVPVETVRA